MAGRVEYLEDDTEIVRTRFRKHDNYGSWDDYLGLEHAQAAVVVAVVVLGRAVVVLGRTVVVLGRAVVVLGQAVVVLHTCHALVVLPMPLST